MSLPSCDFFFENANIWVCRMTLNSEKKGMALGAESHSILKGPSILVILVETVDVAYSSERLVILVLVKTRTKQK